MQSRVIRCKRVNERTNEQKKERSARERVNVIRFVHSMTKTNEKSTKRKRAGQQIACVCIRQSK